MLYSEMKWDSKQNHKQLNILPRVSVHVFLKSTRCKNAVAIALQQQIMVAPSSSFGFEWIEIQIRDSQLGKEIGMKSMSIISKESQEQEVGHNLLLLDENWLIWISATKKGYDITSCKFTLSKKKPNWLYVLSEASAKGSRQSWSVGRVVKYSTGQYRDFESLLFFNQ